MRWRDDVGFWDELGKDILATELAAAGAVVETEREVRTRAQRVDCWVSAPAEPGSGVPALLVRMTRAPCAFEIVSRAAGSDDVLNGVRKMLNVAQTLQKGRRLLAHFAPLWVISAERPRTTLRVLGASPMRGWPAGFHRVPGPLPVQLVIVPDLPPGEETHWLRLLGTGETLYQALAELLDVRHDRPGARAVQTLVLSYRQDLELKRGKLSEAEKEFLMRKTAAERIEEFERKTREAGGRDAIERMLSRQLEQRFGALSARVRRKLASASSADLDKWVERVLTAESVEEVFGERQ